MLTPSIHLLSLPVLQLVCTPGAPIARIDATLSCWEAVGCHSLGLSITLMLSSDCTLLLEGTGNVGWICNAYMHTKPHSSLGNSIP